MNQTSPAYDTGLAFWCANDLANMRGGTPFADRRTTLSNVFNIPLSVSHWPATPTVVEHTVFTTVDTLFLAIGGARLWTQVDAYFRFSSERARRNLSWFNEGIYDMGTVIQAHADSIITRPLRQIVYGYSLGGCCAQSIAFNQDFNFADGYSAAWLSFGSPRCRQWFTDELNWLGWSGARYNNRDDPIVHYPPHALEAPLATALTLLATAVNWQHTEHVGPGYTLSDQFPPATQMVPPLVQPIADLFLWSWFLGLHDLQVGEHSIARYADRLRAVDVPAYTRELTPIGAPPVLVPPPRPALGQLLPPGQIPLLRQQALDAVAVERGPQPESPPFYAIKRAGVWSCEVNGNFVAGGRGKRSAQAMARRMNAAWRQWWKESLSNTGNLAWAVDEYFPS